MKQILVELMAAMMPYMKIPVYIGGALVLTGLLSAFTWRVALGWIGWALVALGVFYIACQLMGLYLGMTPTINFGDPRKFEFRTVEFWQVGAGFLVPGLLALFVARRS